MEKELTKKQIRELNESLKRDMARMQEMGCGFFFIDLLRFLWSIIGFALQAIGFLYLLSQVI